MPTKERGVQRTENGYATTYEWIVPVGLSTTKHEPR